MKLGSLIPWSYSKLSLYERCPLQAKLRYIDRIPQEKSPQAERGSGVHTSIEDYLTGATRKLHNVMEPYRHILVELKQKRCDVEFKIGITKDWKCTSFHNGYGRSVLDSAYVQDDLVDIQEWKTGKMYDDHSEQRHLYILFASVNWPKAQRFKIQSYYFDLGKKKTLSLDRADLDEVKQDFNARVTIMANDDILAPRPGFYCSWCPYSRQKGGPCRHG